MSVFNGSVHRDNLRFFKICCDPYPFLSGIMVKGPFTQKEADKWMIGR